MKPRTRIQQEVAHLSKRLPRLTATQKAYAFLHCFKHYAIKRADGTNICTECGHSWKSDHDLADTLCGCTCPHCGMQLEALRTRKSVLSENEYFSIVTTSKQYQVIRFFFVKSRYKAGQAAEYSIYEVVQRWISPDGKTTTVARLRGMSMLYYDQWSEYSDMEVRKNNKLRAYVAQGEVLPVATRSFGAIGVFAIPEMGRFYRHVLVEKGFPHHGAVAFGHFGKELFEVFKYIGVPVDEIGYNQPAGVKYPTENPWG